MTNNKLIKGISGLLLCMAMVSCYNLNKKPDNLLTADMIWQTRANAEAYLNNIYGYVHYSDGGDYASIGGSDESSVCIGGVNIRQMVSGNWSAASYYFYNWGTFYKAIRQSITFEENVDKVPATELSDDLKAQYKAENMFLRGWFYWMLLRQYGPFVKITSLLGLNDDFSKYPRAPFDTCVTYINDLMTKAAARLPIYWGSSANYGRPTKGTCLAVKAQIALLAASELWNGNSKFASFKNSDGSAMAPASYDASKWKTAADAAKAVIDLGAYKLFTNMDNGGSSFDPYYSVRDLFLTNWNNEIIFSNNNWSVWGWTKCSSPGPGGYNLYNATQNMVDAFAMDNGRTIDDPASGYAETGFATADNSNEWGHKKGEWNMYANREPRFYAYIQYNGHPVLDAPTVDDKNYYSSDANKDGTGRVELYYNGKSGQKSAGTSTITGYDVLKRISPSDNIRNDVTTYRPYILIRYAEILLSYAEALNEYDPANADIVKCLDMVRERAGLPGIETVYPSAVGNKTEMRKHILREREVELCFEGDRYYTLVRRLLMGQSQYLTIYSMNVNGDDAGLGFSYTGFYTRTLFQKRYWDDRMYLFPIFQSDIEKDNSIVQNPGW